MGMRIRKRKRKSVEFSLLRRLERLAKEISFARLSQLSSRWFVSSFFDFLCRVSPSSARLFTRFDAA